jgi:hypothetical protein
MNTHAAPRKEPVRNLFEPPVDWTWHQTATECSEATGSPTAARSIRKNGDRPSKQTCQ